MSRKRGQELPWISVAISRIEAWQNDVMVGQGLAYWDGQALLAPDLADMNGVFLAPGWYNIRWMDESPRLAVMAKSIQ